jgi:predicted cupin superfamily sugar epimerase
MTSSNSKDETRDGSQAPPSTAEGEAAERSIPAATVPAEKVAEALALEPHLEGGFFRETYRAPVTVATDSGPRTLATSIVYLFTSASPSRFHRLRSDEIWFYHAGRWAELAMLAVSEGERSEARPQTQAPAPMLAPARTPDGEKGRLEVRLLGPDQPQVFVPGGRWLGARVVSRAEGGEGGTPSADEAGEADGAGVERDWTLVSCVVMPGFEYDDFELAERASLLREFPEAAEIIKART